MSFETLKKLTNFEQVSAADLGKALSMVPVTENVSGLVQGDTISEILEVSAGYVTIRGQKSANPVVVLICKIAGIDGTTKERPIYLSSFIRKHDLAGDFTGMLANDAAFKKASDFDNQGWYAALKASAPFHVAKVDVVPRTINRAGVPTLIQSRQIEFVKGANPKMAGAIVDPTKGMNKAKRDAYNTANNTTWDGSGNQA
jgi:hypothetical protein